MKTMSLLLVAGLLAVACANPGRGRGEVATYDLAGAAPLSAEALSAHAGLALDVRVPAWLDGSAIVYRLDYADPQRVHHYARARWAGPLSPMLQQRLRRSLAIAPGGAPCTVRIDIDEFAQIFAAESASRAEVRGEVLLYGKGAQLRARLPLHVAQPAGGDAASGVRALAAASDTMATTVANWLARQDLSACRATN